MGPNVRRQGVMPLAFAVLLTRAAGLSLAEEHTSPASPRPPITNANALNGQGKEQDSIGAKPQGGSKATPLKAGPLAKARATDEAGTGDGRAKPTGVGSRALMGNEAADAADQPEMATGLDLKGAPVRFPASDTPE